MSKKAVILARVSSKSQEDEGYSLDSQLKLLQKYCASNDLAIQREFKITEGASKRQSRKIFQELLAYIRKNNIAHVAVEKTDRLTRNMHDAVAIDDWLEADERRVLHAVKENIRLFKNAKSDVKFMWNIHLAVAKKYTDNLREEAMKGWAEKLAQGWLPSVPPPGYKTITEGKKRIHVPDPETAKQIQKAFALYLQPSGTVLSVTKYLAESGVTTRKGRPLSKSKVHALLKNPFYIGVNKFNGREYPGAQKHLIPEITFKAVQDKLSNKRPSKYKKHNPVLKGIMTCVDCHKTITWQKQKGRMYGACQRKLAVCKNKKLLREDNAHAQIEETLKKLISPRPEMIEWLIDVTTSDYQQTIDTSEKEKRSLEAEIARVQQMDDRLYDDKLSGFIDTEKYQAKHEGFERQITELTKKLNDIDAHIDETQEEGVTVIELTQSALGIFQDEDKTNNEKREVLTKLFSKIELSGDSISVTLTKAAEAIAQNNRICEGFFDNENNDNQTDNLKQINRSGSVLNQLYSSLWLAILSDVKHRIMASPQMSQYIAQG